MYWFSTYVMLDFRHAIGDITKHKRLVVVFNKIHDEDVGWVDENGRMSKTYTKQDKERMEYGEEMLRKILITAGCDPNDLHKENVMLGHPSGTVKVGPQL